MRILFVHNALRTFVQVDRDILASVHEVDELDLSVRERIFSLPLRLARADLVFAWFASLHSLLPVLGATVLHKPSIVVVGGYDTANEPKIGYGHMAHPWKRHIVRLVCRSATALIVNSRTAEAEVRRAVGNHTPIHMIHHGFDVPRDAMSVEREDLALSIGNISRESLSRKGHEVFVRAAKFLPKVRFMLVGESHDDAVQRLLSIASSNVEIRGFLPRGELDDLYARASAYVQASVHEGFGCALAEAMASGCIPVISRRGALPEVAGEAGIYVDEQDPSSVADGVRRALAASSEQRAAAAERVRRHFSTAGRRQALLHLIEGLSSKEKGQLREVRIGDAAPLDGRMRSAGPLDPRQARVSVVMPVRNEAAHIGETLGSVLAQTFPPERMEILVVDGMSNDGTIRILDAYEAKYSHIRVLRNSRRTAPTSLNLGIRESYGHVIVRVDGHCRLAPDYVQRCVDLLAATGAANVGGLMRAEGKGAISRAVALATSSPFGIGNARFHYLERQELVDTVYLGAFRREVLDEVGGYDEELMRNQDDELNYRIRAAGYGILLSPDIVSSYTPRDSLRTLWRQYYQYGLWKVRVIQKHPGSVQARHLAPASLVLGLLISIVSFAVSRRKLLLLPLMLYTLADGAAAILVARCRPHLMPLIALVFPFLHLGYGSGFLAGVLKVLGKRVTLLQ